VTDLLTPTVYRAVAALFTAIAVLLNAQAAGHIDPTQLVEAAAAFMAVLAIAKAAVTSHAEKPPLVAHDPAPTIPTPTVVGQP
jgi:hypothetical protein